MRNTAKKGLVLAVMLIFAAMVSAPVFAGDEGCGRGDWHHGHGFKHHKHMKHMWKKLGLSDKQKQQMKDVFQKNREAMKPLKEKVRTEQKALMSLLHASPIDETAIRAQMGKVASARADVVIMMAKAREQALKVLTPEQSKKLQEMKAKWEARCEKSDKSK
jgi:Spy/CpxP family protein refolding chaperone